MNKQELENRIKDLESDIQASQNTIEELKKAIANMEEKAWKPEGEGKYYCAEGLKVVSYNYNNQFDKDMISIGNYFKTKERAERALFEQNLRLKLRKFAEDNNDKINWGNTEKFYLMYNYDKKEIIYDYVYTGEFSQIYFSSKKQQKKQLKNSMMN